MAAIADTALVNSADYDSETAPKRTASSSVLKPEFPTPNLVSEKEDPCFSNSKSELGEDKYINVSVTGVDIGLISEGIFNVVSPLPNTTELKCKVLNDIFVPSETFDFPVTEFGKKKLKFQRHWLQKWPWLAYSLGKRRSFLQIFCPFFIRFRWKRHPSKNWIFGRISVLQMERQ